MGFSQISKTLAIASESRSFTFHNLILSPSGKPVVVHATHAGDGTPGFSRASWRAAAERMSRRSGTAKVSKKLVRDSAIELARRAADHCVKSWEEVYEDGSTSPAPCTPDKVYELFEAIIDAQDGLAEFSEFSTWITTADNFREPAIDAVDLGKG
jgi:hypothetical protein